MDVAIRNKSCKPMIIHFLVVPHSIWGIIIVKITHSSLVHNINYIKYIFLALRKVKMQMRLQHSNLTQSLTMITFL